MTSTVHDLHHVDRITAGSSGPPGKRVFYLQARQDDRLVTLIVEKQQVQSLAIGVEKFLIDLQKRFPELQEADPSYAEEAMALEQPIDPAFRVGQIGLGYDEETDRLVLVARQLLPEGEDPESAAVARFWCSRSQMRALSHWGMELASRGRPICGNCGEPIDPEGHFCPKRNGRKR